MACGLPAGVAGKTVLFAELLEAHLVSDLDPLVSEIQGNGACPWIADSGEFEGVFKKMLGLGANVRVGGDDFGGE